MAGSIPKGHDSWLAFINRLCLDTALFTAASDTPNSRATTAYDADRVASSTAASAVDDRIRFASSTKSRAIRARATGGIFGSLAINRASSVTFIGFFSITVG